MGRGGSIYLSYTATVLLASASQVYAGIWDVSIDLGPAPAPEDGPPLSANASRDRSLLPYQIVGIVGSYFGTVLIVGLLLLTVGRRSRLKAQRMAGARATEMVKPTVRHFDPSPVSPATSNRSWYSPRRLGKKKTGPTSLRSVTSNPASPGMDSILSFDPSVIENDRLKRQDEMERLYAAVMAQDDRKDGKATATATEVAAETPSENAQDTSPPEHSRKKPPRLITDAPGLKHLQPRSSNHASPINNDAPRSPYRAIYPPDGAAPEAPYSPISPVNAEYPSTPLSPSYNQQPRQESTRPIERAPSVGSGRIVTSNSTTNDKKGKFRKSLRHLKISSPLPADDNSDGARTPLSPRFYADPGVPPEPPTANTTDTTRTADSGSGNDKDPWPSNNESQAALNTKNPDQIGPVPHRIPSNNNNNNNNNVNNYNYTNEAQTLTDHASTRRDPQSPGLPSSPKALKPPPPHQNAGALNNPLPFRQLAAAQTQQTQTQTPTQLSPPFYPRTPHPLPQTATKTTFLSPTAHRFPNNGINNGSQTPYSPYMPFTPLTPVTPRLASRAERRQREREERVGRGAAIAEEDAVVGEGEMWGDGW